MAPDGTRSFPASYDTVTKVISVIACLVMLVPVFAISSIALGALALAVLLVCYAFSPRRYTVAGRVITVHRLIGPIRIPLNDVRQMRRAMADDFRGCIRLWGNGGLFGYYGLFRTSKLGKCTWYITNRSNAVVLVTGAKTILFSPDDVAGFLAALQSDVPVAPTPAPPFIGSIEPQRFGSAWLGAAIAAVAAAVAVCAFLYSPGPPKLTLNRDTLTIHDRFYPVTLSATSVDVARVRVINLSTDRDWQPTARTNGFANSHYLSGWFRVANGQKVRLYSTGSKRLVLLPPRGNGSAVLIEVQEPEKFIDQVQRIWSNRSKAA